MVLEETGTSFVVDQEDTLLSSMLRAGIGMPYECNAGGCGSCKFILLDGSVQSDIEEPAGLRRSDVRKNIGLACLSKPRSDCERQNSSWQQYPNDWQSLIGRRDRKLLQHDKQVMLKSRSEVEQKERGMEMAMKRVEAEKERVREIKREREKRGRKEG